MKTTITKRFADSRINTVHQDGTALTDSQDGVNVTITLRDGVPVCADVHSDDCSEYAELGLEMEGKKLVGYDGCFELPNEVIELLVAHGFENGLEAV